MRGVGSAGPDASVNRARISGGEKSGNLGLQVGHDGRDAVEWIAAQPWSSGEVFMYGGSYLGMTQWRTAAQLLPHLSGIAPSVPIYPGWDIPNTNGIPEAFTAVILVYVAGRSRNTDFFASDYWQKRCWNITPRRVRFVRRQKPRVSARGSARGVIPVARQEFERRQPHSAARWHLA